MKIYLCIEKHISIPYMNIAKINVFSNVEVA